MTNQFQHTFSVKKARVIAPLLLAVLVIGMLLFWWVAARKEQPASAETGGSAPATATGKALSPLSPREQTYLKELGTVTMCVDPDWEPYERINDKGEYLGIAADLVALVAARSGVSLTLVPTKNWEESLSASKEGKCLVLSFLNQTPKRDEWLLFTEPYFSDPNVFITREEHDFISNPATLSGQSITFPAGTSLEERIRSAYPNLSVRIVSSEEEALQLVSERTVDMTVRSLAMTAYTIKKNGLFNLKIAGQVPDFTNYFRMGVVKSQPLLRNILDKGVRSITPQEVQQIVNKHISINVQTAVDYALMIKVVVGFTIFLLVGLLWNYQLRKVNRALAARETELVELSRKLNEDIATRMQAEEALEELNRKLELLSGTDSLTGIANRRRFDEVLAQEHARHARSGTALSLIMLDVDHFKAFNDCYGHVSGDDCLRRIGQVLGNSIVRPADLAARYGGEEFACILPETDLYGAVAIAEKLRRGILACEIPHKGSKVAEYVTASIGVVSVQCGSGRSVVEIIAHTDELLYKAKLAGRNRVEFVASDHVVAPTPLDIKSNLVQLVWKESFCCGNQLIDSQHQQLFDVSNELFKAVLSSRPAVETSSIIARLLEDVSRHFHDEQQLLESIRFLDIRQHTAEHDKLVAKGLELSQQFKESTLSVGDVFQFLVHDVVMVHMLGADREYYHLIGAASDADQDAAAK
ncbi:MAG: diguanylate cyclase [Desulfuromonadaceae bacterium]|nr:diguanylate cyclase [Desulfuromonadaceae bacterium]